jgi:outer membrane lipoprotein-sorting protein
MMKKCLILLTFAGLLCFVTATGAFAQKAITKKETPKKEASPNAISIVDSLYKRTGELKKYKFLFDYLETKSEKSKGESRTCDYWYAGPDFLRLVVLEGDDKGSQVVYNAKKNDKAVKAKQSFMPIAISVKKTDPRLVGFFVSDWASDLKDVKKFAGDAKPKLDGEGKIKDRLGYKIVYTDLKGEFDKVIIWVDKKENVLLQYEYYKDGTMKQRKTWHDFDLNPTITDEDFKI